MEIVYAGTEGLDAPFDEPARGSLLTLAELDYYEQASARKNV